VRILWVKAGGLLPLDTGGKIRSYHILRALARKHPVTFFTFYPSHPNDQHQRLESIFERVICCRLQRPAPRGFRDSMAYARNMLSLEPYSVAKYRDAAAAAQLSSLTRGNTFDVLICDFIFAGVNFDWQSPIPKVLFTHNVESQIWKRHYEVASNPMWKAVCWREWKAMERIETRYIRSADHVLTVSEKDKEWFARLLPRQRITAIPTGVDLHNFSPQPDEEQLDNIVFTGSMDWLPNEDAALYFCEQILPRIRQELPNATFWIVGRRPSERLLRELRDRRPGVHVTGAVDDIRPYLHHAAVAVVPLRVGSGTRLKIFEAMSCGKAVVSTTIGAEGLPVTSGRDIVLADDPSDFASSVVELCRNRARRVEIAKNARRLVEECYSWESVAEYFQAALAHAAGP
jgi:sugar transferase (PEP-CTERM/EpsH1 system associated)